MKNKYCIKFSRVFCARISVALVAWLLSYFVGPFYTSGDQVHYIKVYEALSSLSLVEGYWYYALNLSSQEFMHFFLSWIFCRFIEKNLFIAFSNAILAYVAMSLFQKWKLSFSISFFLIVTNFYFLVLYFSAERLKFGFIFLILSFINIDRSKRFYTFFVLSMLSHAQVLIAYLSILFNFFIGKVRRFFFLGKVPRYIIFYLLLLLVPVLLVREQLFDKFMNYYEMSSSVSIAKVMIFFLLALLYSKKKRDAIIVFVPLVIAILLVGESRINIFAYFAFLYYGSQVRNGWNCGVIATSVYFFYASTGFLTHIFQYGDGFFSG